MRKVGHLTRQPVGTGKLLASIREMTVLVVDLCFPDSPRLRNAGYSGVVKSLEPEATDRMGRLLSQTSGAATGFSASAPTQPGRAVEELPSDVQVPGMPRGLLDHVQDDPTNIGWLESTKPVLAQWGRGEGG